MNVPEFLNRPEIKELIAEGDLNTVYEKYYSERIYIVELTHYLLDLGINPLDYFVDAIPEAAFSGMIRSANTTIIIPDTIATIDDYAFYYCRGLTGIVIPASVTTINDAAFARCDNLTDVYYTGTEEQWKAIAISADNDPLRSAIIHFNS